MDIPIANPTASPPLAAEFLGDLPDWSLLSYDDKLSLIKKVIDEEVRPYIELDAGGIKVLELRNDMEVLIAYEGACVTCPSSIGGTLDAISQILKTRMNPHLIVKPDASFLQV